MYNEYHRPINNNNECYYWYIADFLFSVHRNVKIIYIDRLWSQFLSLNVSHDGFRNEPGQHDQYFSNPRSKRSIYLNNSSFNMMNNTLRLFIHKTIPDDIILFYLYITTAVKNQNQVWYIESPFSTGEWQYKSASIY